MHHEKLKLEPNQGWKRGRGPVWLKTWELLRLACLLALKWSTLSLAWLEMRGKERNRIRIPKYATRLCKYSKHFEDFSRLKSGLFPHDSPPPFLLLQKAKKFILVKESNISSYQSISASIFLWRQTWPFLIRQTLNQIFYTVPREGCTHVVPPGKLVSRRISLYGTWKVDIIAFLQIRGIDHSSQGQFHCGRNCKQKFRKLWWEQADCTFQMQVNQTTKEGGDKGKSRSFPSWLCGLSWLGFTTLRVWVYKSPDGQNE